MTQAMAANINSDDRFQLYWERRAQEYAGVGDGLRAVCSYGMPSVYNRAIEWTQQLALAPWMNVTPGTRVLDIGCGIGRWSRALAAKGAEVTGVDLSPTMVAEAAVRAEADGVADRCRFLATDIAELSLDGQFDLIVCVTVLQHVMDIDRKREAMARIREHLAPSGTLVLLEAAPSISCTACDRDTFEARSFEAHQVLFKQVGLELKDVTGVDWAPLKARILPRYARLPRWLAVPMIMGATLAVLPIDLLFGRANVNGSWHKVMVLGRNTG